MESSQALLPEFRIGNRAALFAHSRLPEPAIGFEQLIVLLAFLHIPPSRPGRRHVAGTGLRAVGHYFCGGRTRGGHLGVGRQRRNGRQASGCDSYGSRIPQQHDITS
jgi:hypothetical protein